MTDGNIYSINKYLDEREGYSEPKAASWENREIELDGATYVLKLKGEADRIEEMEAKLAEAAEAFESILKIPNSDAAQGVMKVFARAALTEIGGDEQ